MKKFNDDFEYKIEAKRVLEKFGFIQIENGLWLTDNADSAFIIVVFDPDSEKFPPNNVYYNIMVL